MSRADTTTRKYGWLDPGHRFLVHVGRDCAFCGFELVYWRSPNPENQDAAPWCAKCWGVYVKQREEREARGEGDGR